MIQMLELLDQKDGDLKFQKDDRGDSALNLCKQFGDKKKMDYLQNDLKLEQFQFVSSELSSE